MRKPLKPTACHGLIHIAALCAGAILASCATPPNPNTTSAPNASSITSVNHRNWAQVSSHPPIWYPHGVRKDTPTDFHNGEWFPTGDDADTRFFIPFKGIPSSKRQTLRQEALALRSVKKRTEIENDDKFDTTTAVTVAALMPVGIPIFMATEVVGIYIPPLRVGNW